MKKTGIIVATLAIGFLAVNTTSAQECFPGGSPCGGGTETVAKCIGKHGYAGPVASARAAHQDKFHPARLYAYSRHGVDATRTNAWNGQQMQTCPWHGNFSYWRYQRPTALIVPPTASFASQYNWGVAQTKSLPIYHQYGRNYPGVAEGEVKGGSFYRTPYWPSSTSQFGVYPVRAPF